MGVFFTLKKKETEWLQTKNKCERRVDCNEGSQCPVEQTASFRPSIPQSTVAMTTTKPMIVSGIIASNPPEKNLPRSDPPRSNPYGKGGKTEPHTPLRRRRASGTEYVGSRKRQKSCVDAGRWFTVMLARNRDDGESCRAERTTIKVTQNIAATLSPSRGKQRVEEGSNEKKEHDEPGNERQTQQPRQQQPSQWKVVFAIGPVPAETTANSICKLWMQSQRGVIPKAARGEAISIVYDIPGFVDWDIVLGSSQQLNTMYDVVVCKNPCTHRRTIANTTTVLSTTSSFSPSSVSSSITTATL